jgi:hypothetical protein
MRMSPTMTDTRIPIFLVLVIGFENAFAMPFEPLSVSLVIGAVGEAPPFMVPVGRCDGIALVTNDVAVTIPAEANEMAPESSMLLPLGRSDAGSSAPRKAFPSPEIRGVEASEPTDATSITLLGVESIAAIAALSAENPVFAFPLADEAAFAASLVIAALSSGFTAEAKIPVL